MTEANNKKTINKIEKIYKQYLIEIEKLKNKQDELFKKHALKSEQKGKDKLLKSIKNFKD